MSNDQNPQNPATGKSPLGHTKHNTTSTEKDLWDLGDDLSTLDARPTKANVFITRGENPKSIPSIKSRNPTEAKSNAVPPSPAPEPRNEGQPAAPEIQVQSPQPDPPSPVGDEWDNQSPSDQGENAVPAAAKSFLVSFSRTERIAVCGMFAILALSAVLTIIHFSGIVKTQNPATEEIDYPVMGKFIEIQEASTHWRKPVTYGQNADVVRRGVELVPVISIKLKAKPCAIRVFFRNDSGILVGDAISRQVSGEMEIQLPATDGYADKGMHTSYRTGDQKPWYAEVYEGPSATADKKHFRRILRTVISTDIR